MNGGTAPPGALVHHGRRNGPGASHRPGLVLTDSLAHAGWEGGGLPGSGPVAPVLALLDERALESAGPVLAEQVQDFLVRPFGATELLVRVGRLLRRASVPPPAAFTAGAFRFDLRTGEVSRQERPLSLTRNEVALCTPWPGGWAPP